MGEGRVVGTVGLLIAAAWVAALPHAVAGDGHAQVDEASVDGAGWVGWAFTDDGHGRLAVEIQSATLPATVGLALSTGNGRLIAMDVVAFLDDTRGTEVHAGGPMGADLTPRDGPLPGLFQIAGSFHWETTLSGGFQLIAFSAGGISATSFSLETGEGSQTTAERTGTDTFVHTTGDLDARVSAEQSGSPVGARGLLLAEQGIEIERSLVGVFDHGPNATDLMTVDGPDGMQTCPCRFSPDRGADAGSYTFRATGMGVGEERWILLTGADAALAAG